MKAASFFAARGYRVIDGKEVAHAIQRSTEFRPMYLASVTCTIRLLAAVP